MNVERQLQYESSSHGSRGSRRARSQRCSGYAGLCYYGTEHTFVRQGGRKTRRHLLRIQN